MQKRSSYGIYEYLIPVVLTGGIALVLIYASGIILPIILSFALAYLLNPVVSWFEVRGFSRLAITSAIYAVMLSAAAVVIYVLFSKITAETNSFIDLWPNYFTRINALLTSLEKTLADKAPFLVQAGLTIDKMAAAVNGKIAQIPGVLISLVPALTYLVLVPFISFFLLTDARKITKSIFDLIPSYFVEPLQHVFCEANQSMGNYLRGILIEVAALSIISLCAFLYMGLNYSFALAIMLGISAIIPYVGPVCAGLLCVVFAYLQFETVNAALAVLLFVVLLRFFDDWAMQPYIMKHAVKLHPIIIVLALLAGAEMFGIWGIVFAMPATCIIKVVYAILMEFQRSIFAWKPTPEPTRISIPYT